MGVQVKLISIKDKYRIKVKMDGDEKLIDDLSFLTDLQGIDIAKNFDSILKS